MKILKLLILRQTRFLEICDTSEMSELGFVVNYFWGESASSSTMTMATKTMHFGSISR